MKLAATLLLSRGLALGLALSLLGACVGSKQPETVTPATSGTNGAGGTTTQPGSQPGGPAIAAEAYGAVCSNAAPCAAGLSCTTYYGIAGTNGPAFQSCELVCVSDKDCPSDTTCVAIADGPGLVCRPKG